MTRELHLETLLNRWMEVWETIEEFVGDESIYLLAQQVYDDTDRAIRVVEKEDEWKPDQIKAIRDRINQQ